MWTTARVEQLAQLWKSGMSASECARALGGCSRNAVIGKIHRLGLAGCTRPFRPSRPVRTYVHRPPAQRKPKPPGLVRSAPGPIIELAGTATIATLTSHMCHWPIGDPGNAAFTFCGRLRSRGAYCETHAAAAYRPAKADLSRIRIPA